MRCQFEEVVYASAQAAHHARLAGIDAPPLLYPEALALVLGPRPAGEALTTLAPLFSAQPSPATLALRGWLLAMLDRIEEAWAVALPADERGRELGTDVWGSICLAEIATLAGDDLAAAAHLRRCCDAVEASGRAGLLSVFAPRLGRILCGLGRHDEAEQLARQGRELAHPDDVRAQTFWRQAQALVLSAHADHAAADQLAREAVDFAARSDSPMFQGGAYSDLADVLEAAGRREEALAAWRGTLDRYKRKQIIPLARRMCERIAALQEASAYAPELALVEKYAWVRLTSLLRSAIFAFGSVDAAALANEAALIGKLQPRCVWYADRSANLLFTIADLEPLAARQLTDELKGLIEPEEPEPLASWGSVRFIVMPPALREMTPRFFKEAETLAERHRRKP